MSKTRRVNKPQKPSKFDLKLKEYTELFALLYSKSDSIADFFAFIADYCQSRSASLSDVFSIALIERLSDMTFESTSKHAPQELHESLCWILKMIQKRGEKYGILPFLTENEKVFNIHLTVEKIQR